jgi:predicted DNA-binding transcriptional regulator AlpA
MEQQSKQILEELKSQGYPLFISKKQYAEITQASLSSIDNYMAKGYGVPEYKKLGEAKNAKVLFNLIDVANYLAQTVKTV